MLVIVELLPKIQDLQAGAQKANTPGVITDFLQRVTLVDVLPPAPALHLRKFLVRIHRGREDGVVLTTDGLVVV